MMVFRNTMGALRGNQVLRFMSLVGVAICMVASLPEFTQARLLPLRDSQRSDTNSAKKNKRIPWSIRVSQPYLSFHQRLQVDFQATIPAKALSGLGETVELVFVVKLSDYRNRNLLDERKVIAHGTFGMPRRGQLRLTPEREIICTLSALLLPGEYWAEISLEDADKETYRTTKQKVRVKSISRDPLLEAWRNLPPVEFLRRFQEISFYAYEEADSKLFLTIPTVELVRVDILAVCCDRATVGTLGALSSIQVSNGFLAIRLLEPSTRTVLFAQENRSELAWQQFRAAIKNAERIPAGALWPHFQDPPAPTLLRIALTGHLDGTISQNRSVNAFGRSVQSKSTPGHTRRIAIVLSSPLDFASGSDLTPILAENSPYDRVYYLQILLAHVNYSPSDIFEARTRGEWPRHELAPGTIAQSDHLTQIMQKLNLRVIPIQFPIELRRAVATILKENSSN